MSLSEYFELSSNAISETISMAKERHEEDQELKKENGERLIDKIKNTQLAHYDSGYDDNIDMPAGTLTLLGADFTTLYESSSTQSVAALDSDGNAVDIDVIKADCSYPTEMHTSGYSWTDYNNLSDTVKAVMEITLLTKKYAALPDTEDNAESYAGQMALYRQYCDNNNLEWESIVGASSLELQQEVVDYTNSGKSKLDLYDQLTQNSAKSAAQAVDAHNLLLTCLPEGATDPVLSSIQDGTTDVSYEDTLDATYDSSFTAKGVAFLGWVSAAFKEIYDKLPHPIEWAKSVWSNIKNFASDYAANAEALADDFDQQSNARSQELEDTLTEIGNISSDIKNSTVGQKIDEINGAISDEVQQFSTDPSGEIAEGREWLNEKTEQAKPYIDAAGDVLQTTGENIREQANEFVEKWSTSDTSINDTAEEYEP